MRLAFLSVLLFLSAATAPALAQGPDETVGKRIAQDTCASCHAVTADPDAISPDPKAPRFLDVARMPSTTELSLKVFLRSSHRNMPNFILSPEEMDSVTWYILGLRKK
ncbi:c-type cytochrome [Methylocystis sp. JR02]|uniref:c-type cytochrome n=1 Tax=Methylocystis sp. JR02 TaxID=3046284 RepID=UPI0024B9D8EB|nr:c-type cytochrome [Methylocystis sp. JR02]MDJ0449592.1 cytochrome c [Methylocystis sp. JR02]